MGHNMEVGRVFSLNMPSGHVRIKGPHLRQHEEGGILLGGSVSQVLHYCLHKVASGRVPAEVSCSNLGCAQKHMYANNRHTEVSGVQGQDRSDRKRSGGANGGHEVSFLRILKFANSFTKKNKQLVGVVGMDVGGGCTAAIDASNPSDAVGIQYRHAVPVTVACFFHSAHINNQIWGS